MQAKFHSSTMEKASTAKNMVLLLFIINIIGSTTANVDAVAVDAPKFAIVRLGPGRTIASARVVQWDSEEEAVSGNEWEREPLACMPVTIPGLRRDVPADDQYNPKLQIALQCDIDVNSSPFPLLSIAITHYMRGTNLYDAEGMRIDLWREENLAMAKRLLNGQPGNKNFVVDDKIPAQHNQIQSHLLKAERTRVELGNEGRYTLKSVQLLEWANQEAANSKSGAHHAVQCGPITIDQNAFEFDPAKCEFKNRANLFVTIQIQYFKTAPTSTKKNGMIGTLSKLGTQMFGIRRVDVDLWKQEAKTAENLLLSIDHDMSVNVENAVLS